MDQLQTAFSMFFTNNAILAIVFCEPNVADELRRLLLLQLCDVLKGSQCCPRLLVDCCKSLHADLRAFRRRKLLSSGCMCFTCHSCKSGYCIHNLSVWPTMFALQKLFGNHSRLLRSLPKHDLSFVHLKVVGQALRVSSEASP